MLEGNGREEKEVFPGRGEQLRVCGRRRVLAAARGLLQKMKKSVAPALPYVGCWLTGEDGAAAAGGENRLRGE